MTPLRCRELINKRFGDRLRLVSVDGSGHGVYITGDNACALNTTTSFLVDRKLPKRDRTRTLSTGTAERTTPPTPDQAAISYSTLYAHLDSNVVHDGAAVWQCELIGTVEKTHGNSAGISTHLHVEFRNRGSGQAYPDHIRSASFHGDPFDCAAGRETYVSQNCGASTTSFPGLSITSRGVGGWTCLRRRPTAYGRTGACRTVSGAAGTPWVGLGPVGVPART